MEVIRIEGGHPITGEVTVEGAKNSALKLMAATILAPGVSTLTNVPNIADVHVMGKVLKELGAKIEVVDEHTLVIDTSAVDRWETPYHLVAQMRASTAVLGPLIGRFGKATVAMPGGCNIGARKIDMHLACSLTCRTETSVLPRPRALPAPMSPWTSRAWEPPRTS